MELYTFSHQALRFIADRIEKGEKPACVLHCLGLAMDYGPVEELAKKMAAKGKKMVMFVP